MSKHNMERELKVELEVLNYEIDKKIIKGLSYAREARRHKWVLSNLARLRKSTQEKSSWFASSFNTFSII